MKKMSGIIFAIFAIFCATSIFAKSLVEKGDTIVLIGDSITELSFTWQDGGFYHLLTNHVPQANWRVFGYGGHHLHNWPVLERRSLTDDTIKAFGNPNGPSLKSVLDGKVDIIVIALGMNDLLRPTLTGTDKEIDEWLALYEKFVRTLEARCHPRLFVFATITPLTADATSPKNIVRQKMCARLKKFAKSMRHAVLADYGEAIEDAQEETREINDDYKLVPDFVHPDTFGHLFIAKELCDALELEAAEDALERKIDAKLAKMKKENDGRINLRLRALRSNKVTDKKFSYELKFDIVEEEDEKIAVRPIVPTGWTTDRAQFRGEDDGVFRVTGAPTTAETAIGVEVTSPRGTRRKMIQLPAPWRVKAAGTTDWVFYSADDSYSGGLNNGSIDPYQTYFGDVEDRFTASRKVWSEKAREVKAIFSHQTFSSTLDLELKINNQLVWETKLDRNGKNRDERVVRLAQGWNTIEVTASHHYWQRQFAFNLEPVAGDSFRQLKYSIDDELYAPSGDGKNVK